MSPRQAPLYVMAHDLVVSLHTAPIRPGVSEVRCRDAAHDLLEALSLALTFPLGRDRWLAEADAAVVRLRVNLRVLVATGGLPEATTLPMHARLMEIGRMLGGWRRELRRRGPPRAGAAEETQRAATGTSAAGPTTTPPTGVGPPTATTAGPGTPTTTGASVSSCPPPPASGAS